MNIGEVMTRNVEVVQPDTSVRRVAELMRELDVGMLPVCEGERLVGTITDRDIVIRGVAEGCDGDRTKARDLMSTDVVYCFEDQDTEEAADIMNVRQIRRLIVLDRSKHLAGVVSLGDLAVRYDEVVAGSALEGVSQNLTR